MGPLVLAAVMAASCARTAAPGGGQPIPLQEVIDEPASFDGKRISVSAAYFGAFEMSVLTTGFAESYPPMPVEPLVWVAGSPDGPCLQVASDEGHGESWADRVVATGTFGYAPGGEFGHLGTYEMELADARVRCA